MKPPLKNIDALMRGQIRNPSPRFEEALRQIPEDAVVVDRPFVFAGMMKTLAVAASLTLGFFVLLQQQQPVPSADDALVNQSGVPLTPAEAFPEEEWLDLLTLASLIEDAEVLANADTRAALDYYAFNP
jgi:hypothetical protein